MATQSKTRTGKRASAKTPRRGHAVAMDHRLGPAELRRIAEKIFKLSEADETEVDIDAVTERAHALRQQHHSPERRRARPHDFRAHGGRRPHGARHHQQDRRRIAAPRNYCSSGTRARASRGILTCCPCSGNRNSRKSSRFFAQTAAATPDDRARAVTSVCHMADKNKQTTAGIFSTGLAEIALANSRGLFAYYDDTRAEFSVTILEKDSSGWAKATSSRRE